jgi:Ca2+-binding RTX toxin-like protein
MSYQDILDQGFEVEGTEGDDDIEGTNLKEQIDAKGGDDIVRSLGGDDTVAGGEGADMLRGGEGDDALDGGSGDDALYGEAGSDVLAGGAGEDSLDGGLGDDTLAGGEGVDSYLVYGGMGKDRATDGEGGERNVLSLAPGMSVAGLRFTRVGDALEVGVKGTEDSLAIEDYYTRSQAWAIRDADGNDTDLEDALLIPDPNVGNYVAQLREEARQGQLARAGGAALLAGWKPLGGGLFEGILDRAFLAHVEQTSTETFTSVSTGQVLASNTTQEIDDEVLEIGLTGAPYLNWQQHRLETARIESDAAVIIGPGNTLPDIVTTGEAVVTLRREVRRYNEQHSTSSNSGGVVSYDTGSEVVLANVTYENTLDAWNQFASITKVDEDLATIWGQPVGEIIGNRALVNLSRIENRYLNVVEIVGGDSANAISAVSGGAGIFSILSLVDGGAGDDAISGSGFLYGNVGDDTITGSGTLIGGEGDDTLTGAGASRFVFTAEETGIDTLSETVSYAMPYLQWFHGSANVEERYRHGGEYRLDVESSSSYYATLQEAEAAQQGFGFGSISFVEPLGASAPVVRVDDAGTLDQLVAAGVMPRDVVEFGPGLTIDDLEITLQSQGAPADPLAGGGSLSVRWNDGAAGFDVDLPDSSYGLVGADLLFDQFGDGEEGAPNTYRLGEGVEEFRFADGSRYGIGQLLALAQISFGDYAFAPAPQEQSIDRGYARVVFDPALSAFGLRVTRDGRDLLFGTAGGEARGRIPGWYSDPDNMPSTVFTFDFDPEIGAETLTELGLHVQGTEDDDTLAGLDGFEDVIFGAGGNDAITGGSGSDGLSGGDGDDTIVGGADEDLISGGAAIDLLYGGEGADELEDFEDAGLIDAGAGEDFVYEEGNAFVIGGVGDDYVEHFGDGGVIAFNPGDGNDTVYAAGGFTLSIGGGITTADLSLVRDGEDLVLAVGAGDSIRLTREFEADPQDWPAITLQLFGSVHTYDLTASIDGSIEDFHLADSETEALGGALAWQYATTGSLEALSDAEIRQVLADPDFGFAPQPIALESGNEAPEVDNPIADQAANEDAAWSFTVPTGTFSDPDTGDTLTLSASLADGSALPAWLSFDAATRTLSGTPTNDDVGTAEIALTATDAGGLSASDTFALIVANVNDAPVVANAPGEVLVAAGSPFAFALAADTFADPDAGEALVYSAASFGGGPLPGWLSFDAAALGFSGTAQASDIGAWPVAVTATDGAGESVSAAFNLAVRSEEGATVNGNSGDNILYGNTGDETLAGKGGDDYLAGYEGEDTLRGGGGNDVLQGGSGNDVLRAGTGRNVLDGGSGADLIYGGRDGGVIIGGTGNDVIRTGKGTDLLAFNRGDGQDTVYSDREGNNTLSLGGGITYEDLRFRKSGKDLVLELGGSDSITFKHWYKGQGRTSLLNIQIVTEAMAGFDDQAGDPMLGSRVNNFDARGLVDAFDAARAADPYLTSWALSSALAQFHLWGSDEAALGGDLAYQYGLRRTLAGISLAAAQEVIGAPGFGSEAQTLRPFIGLQEGFVKLS